MHYVQTSITIGTTGTQFTLNPGDLLLVLDPGVGTVALNGGDGNPANDFSADRKEHRRLPADGGRQLRQRRVFHALDDGVKNGGATYNVHALALVETATTVGGVVLPAGTFVSRHSRPVIALQRLHLHGIGTGAAAATQTSDTALLLSALPSAPAPARSRGFTCFPDPPRSTTPCCRPAR